MGLLQRSPSFPEERFTQEIRLRPARLQLVRGIFLGGTLLEFVGGRDLSTSAQTICEQSFSDAAEPSTGPLPLFRRSFTGPTTISGALLKRTEEGLVE